MYSRPADRLINLALWPGVLVPFAYYGIQAAAAPYFPGFSFVGTTASELGSDLSRRPAVFNAGIMAMGAATLVAAAGFFFGLRRIGADPKWRGPQCGLTACGTDHERQQDRESLGEASHGGGRS